MRITLLRHGEPALRLGGIVRAGELKSIARSYDATGIVGEPPPSVIEAVRGHNTVICSGLERSQELARVLGFSDYEMDPMFNEAAMPYGESVVSALARARQGAARLGGPGESREGILGVRRLHRRVEECHD